MIRQPLNVIPTWIVQILQTRVALQRIETFLNEDEVDEQVSSIKRASMNAGTRPTHTEFGLRRATLRWNTVEEKKEEDKSQDNKNKKARDPAPSDASDATAVETTDAAPERVFELSDISVIFPEGELSVVTGPTASGKTALLVSPTATVYSVCLNSEFLIAQFARRDDSSSRRRDFDVKGTGESRRTWINARPFIRRADTLASASIY